MSAECRDLSTFRVEFQLMISGSQVECTEHCHTVQICKIKLTAHPQPTLYTPCGVHSGANFFIFEWMQSVEAFILNRFNKGRIY